MKNTSQTFNGAITLLTIVLGLVLVSAGAIQAAPPHPELVQQIESGRIQKPYYLANIDRMYDKGINTGQSGRASADGSLKLAPNASPSVTGTFKALAILVQFSDKPSSVSTTYFDSLLFDSSANSVRNYYGEVSSGQLDIVTVNLPTTLGWRTAPQTYAYYVNGQNGTGPYPQNCQKLLEDLVDQVDALVDFSRYDNDGDSFVDVVIMLHTGTGAEKTGSSNDIWSHKWSITPRYRDGVYISDYTVQPELWVVPNDMTIGVYCHELGHVFGLPDLYDTDATGSHGVGTYGIMAYGSWLGPGGLGGSPSHPTAWSRIQMGFATPTNVTTNMNAASIPQVETGGQIYRLWTSGSMGDEYFLVENRQKTGYDSYLYGSGLLVWHIDDGKATSGNTDNAQEWWPGLNDAEHYRVALEQADGLWEIEHKIDYGDANDPFPGGLGQTVFDATTTPSSDSYTDGISFVKIDNVSASAPVMTADLVVGFAADIDSGGDDPIGLPTTVVLAQNYPNPFNPSTSISFTTSATTDVRLDIYNQLGRQVATLLDATVDAGETTVVWDGHDATGHQVASGIYLYRLSTEAGSSQTRKMILVK